MQELRPDEYRPLQAGYRHLQESMRTYVNADPNEDDYERARLLALEGWKKIDSVLRDLLGSTLPPFQPHSRAWRLARFSMNLLMELGLREPNDRRFSYLATIVSAFVSENADVYFPNIDIEPFLRLLEITILDFTESIVHHPYDYRSVSSYYSDRVLRSEGVLRARAQAFGDQLKGRGLLQHHPTQMVRSNSLSFLHLG